MTEQKKIAVILSGCGVYDGSEIHEATLSLLALDKNDIQYDIFAPNIDQYHVINHITGEEIPQTRNVLIESARIARGNISDLSDFNSDNYHAILLPGGFGVAKNLSSYAFEGETCSVNEQVQDALIAMNNDKKPIGALCIAPAIIARVLHKVEVTIGNDEQTIQSIEMLGGKHKVASYDEVVFDKENNIVTTPCYMLDVRISEISKGIDKLVSTLVGLME
ncbi:MAG: isoprenoid biosynthesis glyoxalase ElbB [Marinifilaceae bacterium]|jgi:enhancing lycopene biosynthesis protein 2|nr:isoprenoid biosynthesis glyoxalase ElbB [Marinifilaceae bacterium]